MILGIDEVGRGAWAGPLVVGACVLNGAKIDGLTDSKALSKKRREELAAEILASEAIVGWVGFRTRSSTKSGLARLCGWRLDARSKRFRRNVAKNVKFTEIIIDGTINFLEKTPLEKYVSTLKKPIC